MLDDPSRKPPRDAQLPTTHWTLVQRLQSGDPEKARRALDDLCSQYHYPLYCYIRRRGLDHHDAQDALQDFMAKLVRVDAFESADAGRGRLRSLLLTALQRFLINWRRDQHHRGRELGFDVDTMLQHAENRYRSEQLTNADTPDRLFDRKWAQELMAAVMGRLQSRYEAKGAQQCS